MGRHAERIIRLYVCIKLQAQKMYMCKYFMSLLRYGKVSKPLLYARGTRSRDGSAFKPRQCYLPGSTSSDFHDWSKAQYTQRELTHPLSFRVLQVDSEKSVKAADDLSYLLPIGYFSFAAAVARNRA